MIFQFLQKIWNWIKRLFSNAFEITLARNTIKNSRININNGHLIQTTSIVDFTTKESVQEFGKQMATLFQSKYLIDVNNDKFQFYINQSLLILNLNDSETKRKILKELLLKKFAGNSVDSDDSDAPTTIALDAMKYLTDATLKRLCVHRLLTNVLPSIMIDNKQYQQASICDFINKNGVLNDVEVLNLRRLGVLFDTGMKIYSCDEIRECPFMSDMKITDEPLFWSSYLSPAGIELTSITLEHFLHLKGSFNHWLPLKNKSLHLKGLIVDEDVMVKKDIVANGQVAAGGIGEVNS